MRKIPENRAQQLEEMERLYKEQRIAIKKRLNEFANVPPSEYFFELIYCLLTPQSSAKHAELAVAHLRAVEFNERDVDPEPILRQKDNYIRFHKTKAHHLIRLKNQFPVITIKLVEPISSLELREWLVKNVVGLGYKEATHFLRNIGKSENLAILDRHILRTLKRLGVTRLIPSSISRKRYLQIERRFAEFANNIGIPLDDLDLLFWSIETGEIRK